MPTSSRASRLSADGRLKGEERSSLTETANDRSTKISPWLIAGRVIFTLALIGCIIFIFSNSAQAADASSAASGFVLAWMQKVLRALGAPGAASRLTMHFVRKLAHFCEYALEGFLLMLCLRVYTRHFVRHLSWPLLGGVLTALADETIQLYSPGRTSQVTDVWIDFAGVTAGLLFGLFVLAFCRMCAILYKHRNED